MGLQQLRSTAMPIIRASVDHSLKTTQFLIQSPAMLVVKKLPHHRQKRIQKVNDLLGIIEVVTLQ